MPLPSPKTTEPRPLTPYVVFQPRVHRGLRRGIAKIVSAVQPTLGPHSRVTAVQHAGERGLPDLFDNGAEIVRRILQIPDRDEDLGAMLVRDMMWRVQLQVGDGTAMAALLYQAVYDGGVHYLASDGHASRLRSGLEKGIRLIIDQLGQMTTRLEGKPQLARLAASICYDESLALLLGEIFEIIGEFGRVEIREGRGRRHEREYVEGMYWDSGLMSRWMATDQGRKRCDFENAAILITDLEFTDPRQLLPALAAAIDADLPALLIIANNLSDAVLSFLAANKKPEKFQAVAVRTPGFGDDQMMELQNLTVLTGGRSFLRVLDSSLEGITVADFGYARRVWADMSYFGVVGGKGDARGLREHLVSLRRQYAQTEDPVRKAKLRAQIGKLMGGSATLWIGGTTESEIKRGTAIAERTAQAMRGALADGVVPGGGAALLACHPALEQAQAAAEDPDERAAYRILARAVEAPMRAIIRNAGFDEYATTSLVRAAGQGYGLDVETGRVVDMAAAGIYDPANVVKSAAYAAISGAALALTVDVVVHRRRPPLAEPPSAMLQKRL